MVGIYKIENNINKKCYVGQSVNIDRRWKRHKSDKADKPLYRAFKKYGIENFSFTILENCSGDMLNERETYWEKQLKPSYNIFPCGYSTNYIMPKSTKLKISRALKGKPKSKEHRENMVKRLLKMNKDNIGKKQSKEHIEVKSNHILCVETGDIFIGLRSAAEWCGGKFAGVSKACNGTLKKYKGYHWKIIKHGKNRKKVEEVASVQLGLDI